MISMDICKNTNGCSYKEVNQMSSLYLVPSSIYRLCLCRDFVEAGQQDPYENR